MGMPIDNSIRILEDSRRWRKKYGIFGSEEDDAINKLLEVAKKYQKIEQILDDCDLEAWEILEKVKDECPFYNYQGSCDRTNE